jgi:hypothetical protein
MRLGRLRRDALPVPRRAFGFGFWLVCAAPSLSPGLSGCKVRASRAQKKARCAHHWSLALRAPGKDAWHSHFVLLEGISGRSCCVPQLAVRRIPIWTRPDRCARLALRVSASRSGSSRCGGRLIMVAALTCDCGFGTTRSTWRRDRRGHRRRPVIVAVTGDGRWRWAKCVSVQPDRTVSPSSPN